MSEVTAPAEQGSAKPNIADNPKEWLEQNLHRDAESAAKPEPAVAPTVNPLEVKLPSDFEHGFFRDKPVSELYKSYREAEAAKQRAERERNENREALDRLRAELAARDQASRTEQARQQQPPPMDPLAEVENLWFTDPKAAAEKMREATLAEARTIAAQEGQKIRQETKAQEQTRQYYENGNKAYETAYGTVAQQSNGTVTRDLWNKRAKALLVELTDEQGPYFNNGGPLNPQNYVHAYSELFGAPAPAVSAPPTASVPMNPPGTKKAPTAVSAPNAGLPTMSAEKRHVNGLIANAMGIDADRLAARIASQGKK